MKVSLKWLASYVDLKLPPGEIARRLTLSTAEVEAIEQIGGAWDHVSIGRVLDVAPHPNADRLRLATVEIGGEPQIVVCGAPNLAPGQRIAFAEVGAHLVDGHTGQPAVLKANTIRGVVSAGMVCSERELGLSDEHEGILVLPEDAPVGAPLNDYLGDTVLDLYSWPHRPDLMSMVGVAREVAALTGETVREPQAAYPAEAGPIEGRLSVEIEAPDLCPRYIGALLEGVHIGPSPRWMQEHLLAAGMRPINNVVDITNFVMLELGQPLHAFDYDHITDHRIVVRRAREDERLLTLDGENRLLDARMLVIADAEGPVALAGVMGGAASEVGETTTRVLLEAANFDGISIRSTSTRLQLRSEASARFEKSISAEVALRAAQRAVQLMVDLCGGRAADGVVDAYPGRMPVTVVDVPPARIRTVLGIDVEPARVRLALESLGFVVESGPPHPYRVFAPYWRTDVHIPDDVVEEIVRILGYETVPLTTIAGRVPDLVPEPAYRLRRQVQDLLVEGGLQEVITYSLIAEDLLNAGDSGPALRIVNPASQDHVYLRRSLRASLLRILAPNLLRRRIALGLFEAARVYLPRAGDLPLEPEFATGVIGGQRPDRWGMPSDATVDFFDAKGIVEVVLDRLHVDGAFRPVEDRDMVPGRAAEIVCRGSVIGTVGQIHPDMASRFDLDTDVYLFELQLDRLQSALGSRAGYRPYSRFPATRQDLAVIVDSEVPAGQIEAIIRQGRFVVDVRPFDVYTGAPVPEGRKSIAFAVQYQAADRTLADGEVSRSRARIQQQLRQQLGAQLREG
ncbi:MAG TPA: phenylalanine--tRNA ligase subunit beta [Dehalococcoidia bacterium]|nr:phenylalanine--tRNA ligase subunit beta [Dehalococcoidia bacterium]